MTIKEQVCKLQNDLVRAGFKRDFEADFVFHSRECFASVGSAGRKVTVTVWIGGGCEGKGATVDEAISNLLTSLQTQYILRCEELIRMKAKFYLG
jgi:hypothetical protein